MRSPSSVNRARKKRFTLKWWHFLIFFAISLTILYFIIPQNSTIDYLQDAKPNAVSLFYLRNMVKKNPHDPTYKILLANQELSLGHIAVAEELVKPYYTQTPENKTQWQALWSEYLITRAKAYALNNGPARKQQEELLKEIVSILARSPYLNVDEMLSVANDAVALNMAQVGVKLYLRLSTIPSKISATYFANAAKVALFVSDYHASADLYFIAQDRATTIAQKREYFIKGLMSLQRGNLNDQALIAAKKHIGVLAHDSTTLEYLAKLAVTANRPDIALPFVEKMLHWSN
ncbi:MAG: hypothetical protein KIT56_07750 [Gammaproteobacteria bacterium]|nr:hypothetical protein [Gammaproteobacteria bacterium]MCW5583754.1 hypothetical protein [Gammaproteobacteria bacterium]